MKRFLIPLLAPIANVDPNIHKLCLSTADYSGCKKLNSSDLANRKINVDIDAIKNSGNFCSSNYAYLWEVHIAKY